MTRTLKCQGSLPGTAEMPTVQALPGPLKSAALMRLPGRPRVSRSRLGVLRISRYILQPSCERLCSLPTGLVPSYPPDLLLFLSQLGVFSSFLPHCLPVSVSLTFLHDLSRSSGFEEHIFDRRLSPAASLACCYQPSLDTRQLDAACLE